MNDVFCDKRDCLFYDVDGICNCVMHDGIPYCKIESIDTKKDAWDGLMEENFKLRELMRDMFDGMCRRGPDCRGCEHYELHEGQRFVGECEYHRRMREFGIEVG